MGLFDTVHFDPPLICPSCGQAVHDVQSHHLGECLDDYRIGSVVSACPVLHGVIRDSHYCAREEGSEEVPIYLGIWNSVLVAADFDREVVERRLRSVDRVDLVQWLEAAQKDKAHWESCYRRLCADLTALHEWMQDPKKDKRSLLFFEFLEAEDPLGALLRKTRSEESGEE